MYPQTARARSAYTLTKTDKAEQSSTRTSHAARCAWAWMMTFVECKESEGGSAFHFSQKKKFLRETDDGFQSQAQIAKYAAEIQIRQHRKHVWSFYFAGSWVRVQRWDRSGCMVSEALDLRVAEDKIAFINFLYRFASLAPEDLGYDTTSILATPKEIKMLKDYKSDNGALEWFRDHMVLSEVDFPIHKVIVFPVRSLYTLNNRVVRSLSRRTSVIHPQRSVRRNAPLALPPRLHLPRGRLCRGPTSLASLLTVTTRR